MTGTIYRFCCALFMALCCFDILNYLFANVNPKPELSIAAMVMAFFYTAQNLLVSVYREGMKVK